MYSIVIDVPARLLYLYQGNHQEKSFPVAVGKPETPTPAGTYTIIEKIPYPGGVFGTRWLGLSRRYYGIHGTDAPWLLGQAVSNGCVRMHNADVEYVYDRVEVGTQVRILNLSPEANPGTGGAYVVQPGDSLWLIAGRFGTTVDELAARNHIEPPYIIYPGQKLYLPGSERPPLLRSPAGGPGNNLPCRPPTFARLSAP
ncbi:L,D-transpeptidase family protein [Gelria sp. Kuro-4]|uniref:L,D-transpeptidase family protein n=1 Tax=Gelria sp. Kuro-4 TaxID=2796927 RepID=UPI001BF05120|nr:L,D-transpeptidase family protein [Gelria sp. Kuro-4]BCV23601.1 hypothetical protein kuro4_03740 [Gelria sp. Kuro-4]